MAKHVVAQVDDTQLLVMPIASRSVTPQVLELLEQVYTLLDQAPPPNMLKALRRARSGSLTIEVRTLLKTEQREGRAAQLRRLLSQEQALMFKRRTNAEGRKNLQKEVSRAVATKRSLKKALKINAKDDKLVEKRLIKTQGLIARVRESLEAAATERGATK